MGPISPRQIKRCRGIIVWDFDRVLFDTERFYHGAKKIFKKYGVPSEYLWRSVLRIRKEGKPFSTARVLRILREWKIIIPEKKIREAIHGHLAATNYFPADTDALLHRLRRQGLIHMVISYGAASYLHKRVRVGCGERFRRHFVKISATRRPKHFSLKKIWHRYSALPIFFVDDTACNIELVRKYVPGIVTIHYTKGWSLKRVERTILAVSQKRYVKIRRQ